MNLEPKVPAAVKRDSLLVFEPWGNRSLCLACASNEFPERFWARLRLPDGGMAWFRISMVIEAQTNPLSGKYDGATWMGWGPRTSRAVGSVAPEEVAGLLRRHLNRAAPPRRGKHGH